MSLFPSQHDYDKQAAYIAGYEAGRAAIASLQRDLAERDATIAELRGFLVTESKAREGREALLSENDALRARTEAAEKDAARYRKARLMAITDPTPWDPTNWSVVSDPCSFDEFIDAAIAAGGDNAKD